MTGNLNLNRSFCGLDGDQHGFKDIERIQLLHYAIAKERRLWIQSLSTK